MMGDPRQGQSDQARASCGGGAAGGAKMIAVSRGRPGRLPGAIPSGAGWLAPIADNPADHHEQEDAEQDNGGDRGRPTLTRITAHQSPATTRPSSLTPPPPS